MTNYRLALKSDAEQIALLHARSWKHTYRGMLRDDFLDGDVIGNRRAMWCDRLARHREDQFVLVATDSTGICGFVCAYGKQDPRWGSLIDNLHVAYEHKHGGIGTVLMRNVAAWLAEHHGDAGVYLWVMEANDAARRFYEKLGARNAGTIDKENPGGGSARNCLYFWERPSAIAAGDTP
jgi:ribosomal protein S18 acetylase RimI-like enzyme